MPPPKARKAEEAPQLPREAVSVADIAGPISILCVRSKSESAYAIYLQSQGYDFYNPRQEVITYYEGRRKEWTRAMFPGILFVGNGYDGRVACDRYGRMFHNTYRGFIGHVSEVENACTKQLRAELVKTESLLSIDPSLESVSGLKRGRRVYVNGGAFIGHEGVIDGDGGDGKVFVLLPMLGATLPIPVPRDLLTILE